MSAADEPAGPSRDPVSGEPTTVEASPADILTPIPGRRIDKDPKPKPGKVAELERDQRWVAIGWETWMRFKTARAPLMAAGTSYYGFIAMFSLLAFAYGIAALLDADAIADWLTRSLEEALPGLVGEQGIDPETLASIGRTTSLVGLLLLLVSGAAVMSAASDSLHQVYGAAPDGRNPVARRAHLLGWLVLLGPLVVLSYTLTTAAAGFGTEILDAIDLSSPVGRILVVAVAVALTFALDVGISALLLSRLGGIVPARRAVLAGAVLCAVVITGMKLLIGVIVSWSVDRPQYGSFAIPVTVLVVLWIQSMGLYGAASLTAGFADADPRRPGPAQEG